jgi:predicted nucleic acid-binding protein
MLWPLEVLNGLIIAERRGRLDAQRRQRMTSLLQALPVTIDSETVRNAWRLTSHLAERFRLTVYDATYLELAQRMNLPLATLDQELRTAGMTLGVPLLGLSQ